MAKIYRVEDLPKWFELKKYKEAQSFSLHDWIFSLRIRQNILNSIEAMQGSGIAISGFYALLEGMEHELQQLRCKPLNIGGCRGWASFIGNFDETPGIASVRDLTFSDLISQFRLDHHGAENGDCDELQARRWGLITTPDNIIPPSELIEMPVGTMLADCKPLLIDLRATDSVLMAAFSAWLKSTRKASSFSKRNRPEFGRWEGYGLLPYLDLLIWEKETGSHIPDRVMSAAVSFYDKGESSFRKTLVPLAANLMRDLSELQAMASAPTEQEAFRG